MSILILSALASTLYWLVLFVKISSYNESIRYANFTSPSILISAKNEAQNLKNYLPKVLVQQNIAGITVMNDYSTDTTGDILQSLASEHRALNYAIPSVDIPGKKRALSEGILLCPSETVLLTDADCYPVSEDWACIMASKLGDGRELILGYGPLERTSGLLNVFARYETVSTAIQYFGLSLLNKSYMGVGRNMAFTKDLFRSTHGYSSHENISSGDDDLFVQDAQKLTDVQITLDPDSFMYSRAPEDLKSYIRQKKRHIATSTSYETFHKILLSIHPFFHLVAFSVSLFLLMSGAIKLVIGVWLTRWFMLIVMGYIPFRKLDGPDLIKWIPVLDMLLIGYYIYFGCSAFNKKNASW